MADKAAERRIFRAGYAETMFCDGLVCVGEERQCPAEAVQPQPLRLRLLVHSRGGTRTPDRVINSHLLYHLSYSGMWFGL